MGARVFWEFDLLRSAAATGQAWALTAACELVARCKTAYPGFSQSIFVVANKSASSGFAVLSMEPMQALPCECSAHLRHSCNTAERM